MVFFCAGIPLPLLFHISSESRVEVFQLLITDAEWWELGFLMVVVLRQDIIRFLASSYDMTTSGFEHDVCFCAGTPLPLLFTFPYNTNDE